MVYYVSDKETKSLAFRELFHGFSSFNALMHNVAKIYLKYIWRNDFYLIKQNP